LLSLKSAMLSCLIWSMDWFEWFNIASEAMSNIGTTGVLKASSNVLGVRSTDDVRAEPSPPLTDEPSHPARPETTPLIVPDASPNQLDDVSADTDRFWKREGMSGGRRNARARKTNRVFVERAAR
jgi:hypothetical protein